MNRNRWRANGMQIRLIHLFILSALAWFAPLAALHQQAASADPSIPWCRAVWDVSVVSGDAGELPILAEEEEDQSEVEREPVGSAFVAAPPVTSSWSVLPAPSFAPEELRLVASATPRGPPSSAL